MVFADREREIEALQRLLESSRAELVVVYGRRRVGKTTLVRWVAEHSGLPTVYIVGRREHPRLTLERVARECARVFGDDYLVPGGFPSWESFLKYLAARARSQRVLVVFDEFPDMVASSPELPGLLRDYWDSMLSGTLAKIVVVGSSISMMRRLFMEHESVLYGRRTFELKVKPMEFIDALQLLPGDSVLDKLRAYAVVGGTPGYLAAVSGMELWEVVEETVRKGSMLYEDAQTVLGLDVQEPRTYTTILYYLSHGMRRLGEIASALGMRAHTLYKYISLLELLDIVSRRRNLVGKEVYYTVSDQYYAWWYHVVYDLLELVERGYTREAAEEAVKKLDSHIAVNTLPALLEQLVPRLLKAPRRVGVILRKNVEIDLAVETVDGRLLAVEAKWSDLTAIEAREELRRTYRKCVSLNLDCKPLLVARTIDKNEEVLEETRDGVIATITELVNMAKKGEKLEA